MDRLLAVGKVSRLFGPNGGMMINLYDTFPGNIDHEEPLYVVIDALAVPLFIEEFDRHGRKRAYARFADIDTGGRAEELLGLEVFIEQGDAGEDYEYDEGGFAFEDLVGFGAIMSEKGREQRSEGSVTAFIDSEMNPLFEIELGGKEILIPAADEFIADIDIESRKVEFLLPEGFFELY